RHPGCPHRPGCGSHGGDGQALTARLRESRMPKVTIDPESGGSNTVALDSHALGTLQYIRASIDAAGLLAVPGSAGIAIGAVGIMATVLVSLKALAPHWLQIWLLAGFVAIAF